MRLMIERQSKNSATTIIGQCLTSMDLSPPSLEIIRIKSSTSCSSLFPESLFTKFLAGSPQASAETYLGPITKPTTVLSGNSAEICTFPPPV